MLRPALAAVIITLSAACALPPCEYSYRPATCGLERVELRKTKAANTVIVAARYKVHGALGDRIVEATAFQVFPEGTSLDVAGGKLVAYFDRHPDLACNWGHLAQGRCARDDVRLTLPGCRDQRENTCYELAPEELK